MDLELYRTVEDLFYKAANPGLVYVSIFSQDDEHPDLSPIFEKYNITDFNYEKIDYRDSSGVGFARSQTQKNLSEKYKYYLQIDSHTRFKHGWDTMMINDYEKMHSHWGPMIASSYPPAYEYDSDGEETFIDNDGEVPLVKIVESPNKQIRFESKYCYNPEPRYGSESGYYCAGQVFGYVKYIMQVAYDPSMYFNGEEQTMSVRFFDKGIKIIAPPRTYIYHDYVGSKRKRNWDKVEKWKYFDGFSVKRLNDVFDGVATDVLSLENGIRSYIDFWDRFVLPPEYD